MQQIQNCRNDTKSLRNIAIICDFLIYWFIVQFYRTAFKSFGLDEFKHPSVVDIFK